MIKIGKISSFDLLKLQKDYITRALNEVPGRKVLILDKTTEKSLSQIYTVSELWEFDVYLIESINKMTEEKDQNSLQTIMMIQPSAQNIDSICREISSFKYTDTFICTIRVNGVF